MPPDQEIPHRMLAAIMFTDMVGYTAMMQDNEHEAMVHRNRCRAVLQDAVARHGGSILQFYGDGTLSMFGSAIEATRCALDVQRGMPEEIRLRIGIHVGDIVQEEGGIFGDAVNVASRIEAIAPPGGVCVSDKVFDEIKNQPGLDAVSLGPRELKNVKRPIEIFALSADGLVTPGTTGTSAIRAVIVDDEQLARSVLAEFLARHQDIAIVAECANGFEAVKAVSELKPDLLFLDIQMPKLNGFEVLELIEKDLAVIFVTAFDEFALRAFEVHAVDYLLKPFSEERLDSALAHARGLMGQRSAPELQALAATAIRRDGPSERILVRDGSKVTIIPAADIDYLEAQDDYVAIHAAGKAILKQVTLTVLEEDLDPRRFVRIHRSFILNIDRLAKIELYAKDSRVAILKDGTRLQISRAGYGRLKELL